jgi:hypothetical protein
MPALRERLLERLKRLRPGTTMCPGQLARACGTTLRAARADIMELAREGKIAVSQRGKEVQDGKEIRGPFRVRST